MYKILLVFLTAFGVSGQFTNSAITEMAILNAQMEKLIKEIIDKSKKIKQTIPTDLSNLGGSAISTGNTEAHNAQSQSSGPSLNSPGDQKNISGPRGFTRQPTRS